MLLRLKNRLSSFLRTNTVTEQRWWDVPASLLIIVATFLSAIRLDATGWTDELALIQFVTLAGVITGLALGQSRFRAQLVGWYATGIGVVIIVWLLGRNMAADIPWLERLADLGGRLGVSISDLVRNRAVTDPVLFVLIMAVLFWLLSSQAGYAISREGNAWKAVLPMGFALFVIHVHDPFWRLRGWYLGGYIFLALLLVARMSYLHTAKRWRHSKTHLPPHVGLDFLRATMIAAALVIVLSWTVPAVAATVPPAQQAWNRLARPMNQLRADWSNAFASLQSNVGILNEYYSDNLSLGRGNILNDSEIMTIDAPSRPTAGVRYYWRARVYDQYEGGQWLSSPTSFEAFSSEEETPLPFPAFEGRWEADFEFTAKTPMATLYTVPQPLWISRPAEAELMYNSDDTIDLASVVAETIVRSGEQYRVRASLTNVTVSELQQTGDVYPAWVTERYLEIPASITPRTLALAQEIAGNMSTPYEKTAAVTVWLRENIQYRDVLPAAPPGQEPLDWMLFDLQQGFCNYYASAQVIMLRSLGVPARVAVGYAQGERSSETGEYVVLQRDAHAWPEVFFPGVGWVEFEPTVNQVPISRPVGVPSNANAPEPEIPSMDRDLPEIDDAALEPPEEPLADDTLISPPETVEPRGIARYSALLVSLMTFVFILIIIGLVALYISPDQWGNLIPQQVKLSAPVPVLVERRLQRWGVPVPDLLRQWAYHANLPEQARAYRQINRSLRWLGATPATHFTPIERATALKTELPEAEDAITVLLNEYQTMAYTQEESDGGLAKRAAFVVRNATLTNVWNRFIERFRPNSA